MGNWPAVAVRLSFALAMAILFAIAVLAFRSFNQLLAASGRVDSSHELIDNVDELLTELALVESASRAYIVTADDAFLTSARAPAGRVNGQLTKLRQLTAANPEQAPLLTTLEQAVSKKIAIHERTVYLRRTQGERAAADLLRTGIGRDLMDRIRAIIAQIRNAEAQRLTRLNAVAASDARRSMTLLVLGPLLSCAILGAIYVRLQNEVVRRSRSEKRLERLNGLYATLSAVNQAIVRVRDRDEMFKEACRATVQHGLLRMVWVGIVDPNAGIVHPVAWAGFEDGYLESIRVSIAEEPEGCGPTGSALREGRSFICSDIETDPRMPPWREKALRRGYRSSAAFPIYAERKLAGAFTVYAAEKYYFDAEIVALLEEVASDLGFAVASIAHETQRGQAEREIRWLNASLEKQVEERTAQLTNVNAMLERSNDELARASQMKSEFLSRISHEFRTPLNAISGFSELLAEESDGALPETYRSFVASIRTGARHLTDLINEVLDLSKIEAGRIELRPEEFCAAEALADVLSTLAPLAGAKAISIENRAPADLLIYADRTRFRQILFNLLSNAVKFTPERGRIEIDASRDVVGFRFCVADSGIGIAAEEREAIFDEFHRGADPAARAKEGTGLGLAITKRLVELHGGRIWVDSVPGRGSRFLFTIVPGRGASSREPALAKTV